MNEEEYIRKLMEMINRNSVYGLVGTMTNSEIAKIIHDYIERDIGCDYDRFNSPPPPIPIRPVKVLTLKEKIDNYKRRKKEMEATSTQIVKNVKDICFSIENHPMEMENKLTIVARTDDDIFEFGFEGPDLLQNCKRSGLFTGWEKDQMIKNLEKEKQHLKEKYEEKIDVLQRKYNLEREANEAQRKFFRQYAGEGVEIEFHHVVGDDETTYVIVDKEEYKALKNIRNNVKNNGCYGAIFTNEEPSSRRDILRCAEKCVCGKREQDYGTPESNFQLIADLWNGYLGGRIDNPVISVTPIDVSMMMALLKIARIRNGGGSGDSFVDLAGYAACGGEIWASKKETNTDSN